VTLRRFDQRVIDAAQRLVAQFGQPAREYVAEVVAVASGRTTPGRLEELEEALAKLRAR
jgi:hypothetical protein